MKARDASPHSHDSLLPFNWQGTTQIKYAILRTDIERNHVGMAEHASNKLI